MNEEEKKNATLQEELRRRWSQCPKGQETLRGGNVRNFIRYLKWLWAGKPMIKYAGYNCGCCGRWWDISFEVPAYRSTGGWGDTWGLCPAEHGCWKKESK